MITFPDKQLGEPYDSELDRWREIDRFWPKPYIGIIECYSAAPLAAGELSELTVVYTLRIHDTGRVDNVACLKGVFEPDTNWAPLQTVDPKMDNYLSAEYVPSPYDSSTMTQTLPVRFDQSEPSATIMVDIIVLGPVICGTIIIRIGDRRWGAGGTRVQTSNGSDFRMLWSIDPTGTEGFASSSEAEISLPITAGPPSRLKLTTARIGRSSAPVRICARLEDQWGNETQDLEGLSARLAIERKGALGTVWKGRMDFREKGWSVARAKACLGDGEYLLHASVYKAGKEVCRGNAPISIDEYLPVPTEIFGDLHSAGVVELLYASGTYYHELKSGVTFDSSPDTPTVNSELQLAIARLHLDTRPFSDTSDQSKSDLMLEIGTEWGLSEGLLRSALRQGQRVGVVKSSCEHSLTTIAGSTGVLTQLDPDFIDFEAALRTRRTYATTISGSMGMVRAGQSMQGDVISVKAGQAVQLEYSFCGSRGFEKVEAWSGFGLLWERNLYAETETAAGRWIRRRKIRVSWGGEGIHDQYRYPVCRGSISVQGAFIGRIKRIGDRIRPIDDSVDITSATQITFDTRVSGDLEGIDIFFKDQIMPTSIHVTGDLSGHAKNDDIMRANQEPAQAAFGFSMTGEEAINGKKVDVQRETDIFVSVKEFADLSLPVRVDGSWTMPASGMDPAAVYFVARQHNGGKIVTNPMFVDYV